MTSEGARFFHVSKVTQRAALNRCRLWSCLVRGGPQRSRANPQDLQRRPAVAKNRCQETAPRQGATPVRTPAQTAHCQLRSSLNSCYTYCICPSHLALNQIMRTISQTYSFITYTSCIYIYILYIYSICIMYLYVIYTSIYVYIICMYIMNVRKVCREPHYIHLWNIVLIWKYGNDILYV